MPDGDPLPGEFEEDVEGPGVIEVEEGEVRMPFVVSLSQPELDLRWGAEVEAGHVAGFQVVPELGQGLFEALVVFAGDVEHGPVGPVEGADLVGGDMGDLGLLAELQPVSQGDRAEVGGLRGYGDWGGGAGGSE